MIKTLVNLQDLDERTNRIANLHMSRVCEPSLELNIM